MEKQLGFAITEQPQPQPMVAPGTFSLDYLTTVDQYVVKQKLELLEIATGFEGNNKYDILNRAGQKIFSIKEDTNCCTRQCCGSSRPFDICVKDIYGYDVINIHRELRCQSCCCPCCLQKVEVTAPPGTVRGTVEQNWSCYPSFDVKNAAGNPVLKISGPLFPISCCGSDVEFELFALDGTKIGRASKKWSGFLQEAFTDADTFNIEFPIDLLVDVKIALLGACLLIDFMYFETSGNNNHHH